MRAAGCTLLATMPSTGDGTGQAAVVGFGCTGVPRQPLKKRNGAAADAHMAKKIRLGDLHDLDVSGFNVLLTGNPQAPYHGFGAPLDKSAPGTIPADPAKFRALRAAGRLSVGRVLYCMVQYARNIPNHKSKKELAIDEYERILEMYVVPPTPGAAHGQHTVSTRSARCQHAVGV